MTIRSIVDGLLACEPLRGAGDRPSEPTGRMVFGVFGEGGLSKPATGVAPKGVDPRCDQSEILNPEEMS